MQQISTEGVQDLTQLCGQDYRPWYMHNPAAVKENDSHILLWDFDIQTDHLISARRPDLMIINKKEKKNLQNYGLCCPG